MDGILNRLVVDWKMTTLFKVIDKFKKIKRKSLSKEVQGNQTGTEKSKTYC